MKKPLQYNLIIVTLFGMLPTIASFVFAILGWSADSMNSLVTGLIPTSLIMIVYSATMGFIIIDKRQSEIEAAIESTKFNESN